MPPEIWVTEMSHIFLANAQEMATAAANERQPADYLATLVLQARAGDALAFERIMLATEQRVVSIAWRMLGNRDDARDATQEIYLRVFKYLARFRLGEDFRAWLYRITINVCRDFARKRRAVLKSDETDFADEGSIEIRNFHGDQETRALRAQQLALIRRALQSLPQKERAALVLRDLEGLSTEEVARALRSRPATVRSQISSARTKIRRYCEKLSLKGAPQ